MINLKAFHRQLILNKTIKISINFSVNFPSIQSLIRTSDVIFVSTDELIDFPRPLLPNIVHIGGLGMVEKEEALDEVYFSSKNFQ